MSDVPYNALAVNSNKNVDDNLDVLQQKLRHPSVVVLQEVLTLCNKSSFNKEILCFCETCPFGKQCWESFPSFSNINHKILDLVHTDLRGPTPCLSRDGYKYLAILLMIILYTLGFIL